MKYIVTLILTISFLSATYAKDITSDTLQANIDYQYAEKFFLNKTYDSALFYYEKSAQLYLKHKIWGKFLFMSYNQGYIYQGILNQFQKSIDFLEDKLNMVPEQDTTKEVIAIKSKIYLNIAYSYRGMGEYQTALKEFDKALENKQYINYVNQERMITGKAVTYWYLGDFEKALKTEEIALETLLKSKKKHFVRTAVVYNILGLINNNLGQFNKAAEYYNEGIRILNSNGFERNHLLPALYNNLGNTYTQKNENHTSKEFYEKAYDFYVKIKAQKSSVVSALSNIGNSYLGLKEYQTALEYFEKALKLRLEFLKPDHSSVGESYSNLAQVYFESKEYDKGLTYYKKALKIRKTSFGNHSARVARNYNQIALCYLEINKPKLALNYLDSALSSNLISSEKPVKFLSGNYLMQNSLSKPILIRSILHKAISYQKIYEQNKNQKTIDLTIDQFVICNSLIDQFRILHQSYDDKVEFSMISRKLYQNAIPFLYQLYEDTKNEDYVKRAFFFSEKSRLAVLNEKIAETNAKKFAGIPKDLLSKEKDLKLEISFYKSEEQDELLKNQSADSTKLNEIREKLFSLNRQKEELISLFEKNYPKYFDLKYNTQNKTIPDIQNTLKDESSFIEYFVGKESVYGIKINKETFSFMKLSSVDSLALKIKSMSMSIRNDIFEDYTNTALALYKSLFEPLNIKNTHLTIIPDGVLWYLNFDILIKETPSEADYKSLKYLIIDHDINYAYSGKLLFDNKNSNASTAKKECLAFSFNSKEKLNAKGNYMVMRGSNDLSKLDLPGSRKEITAISEVIEGTYYYGTYANEKNFKNQAKDYKILHLALHGEINNESPMNSKLYFTNNQDSVEDNFLHAYELYNLELNAELAVLSACNTGTGQLVKGEGIMSMGRAFTYAGCKSLIMSQWDLSDETTPKIMKNFYTNLKNGMSKSESLRQAKLHHLENSFNLAANPYFWAAMVQVGNNDPLPQENNIIYILIGFISLVLILVYYFKKYKS